MIIRPVDLGDAEKFLTLIKKVEASGFMLYEPGERKTTVDDQKKMIERLTSDERSTIFVAEIDGNLAGYIVAIGGNVKRNRHSAYLVLGVDEDYQGKGIATKLFNHLFNWAEQVGITRLELTVIKDNIKAFNLYRKVGFTLEGEKVNSLLIDGNYANEYYLYKMLD
ncbi:GNAT family N-acetyltransferase [Bacillaceae bacterium W0354]